MLRLTTIFVSRVNGQQELQQQRGSIMSGFGGGGGGGVGTRQVAT
jgi:hypothetical protein